MRAWLRRLTTPQVGLRGTEEDDFSVEGEDVSKAEQMVGGSDVIEPVNDVELVIKSLRVDKYVPDGETEWKTARMELMLVVGPKGTDGKGKYKNKHFFPRIGFAVNRGAYDFSTNAAGKATNYYDPSGGSLATTMRSSWAWDSKPIPRLRMMPSSGKHCRPHLARRH